MLLLEFYLPYLSQKWSFIGHFWAKYPDFHLFLQCNVFNHHSFDQIGHIMISIIPNVIVFLISKKIFDDLKKIVRTLVL